MTTCVLSSGSTRSGRAASSAPTPSVACAGAVRQSRVGYGARVSSGARVGSGARVPGGQGWLRGQVSSGARLACASAVRQSAEAPPE